MAPDDSSFGSSAAAIADLQARFRERVFLSESVREHDGHDESGWKSMPRDVVIYAHGTDEMIRVALEDLDCTVEVALQLLDPDNILTPGRMLRPV